MKSSQHSPRRCGCEGWNCYNSVGLDVASPGSRFFHKVPLDRYKTGLVRQLTRAQWDAITLWRQAQETGCNQSKHETVTMETVVTATANRMLYSRHVTWTVNTPRACGKVLVASVYNYVSLFAGVTIAIASLIAREWLIGHSIAAPVVVI